MGHRRRLIPTKFAFMAPQPAGRSNSAERQCRQLESISRNAVLLRRQWASIWRIPELRDVGKLQFNPRLTRTVARWVLATRCIEVGPRFFESNRNQTAILCHEYAHAAAMLRFGTAVRPHGPEWRHFVRAAGFKPVTRHRGMPAATRPPSQRRVRPVRFEHRCLICHSVRFSPRQMTSWRCAQCVQDGLPGDLSIRAHSVAATAP
jgi:predicted SprT family Zn-dependent metalloprotease